jgi:regulator of sigma E protease
MDILGSVFEWAGIGLPAFLFVITIVVFFHELGHFAMARAFGVAVHSFSIGFGRELIGWTDRRGTRWKISLLPLGGYVKFAGDANAASQPDEEELEQMDPAERAGSLHFKPLYQRALVVAAGPFANFALAIAIFAALFVVVGKQSEKPIIGHVVAQSAAAEAGILQDDLIRSVNGQPVATFLEFQSAVRAAAGRALTLELQRDDEIVFVTATPRPVEIATPAGARQTVYQLGVGNGREAVGPIAAVAAAVQQTWSIITTTLGYLGEMVTGRAAADQLSGPIGIAKISGDMAQEGFLALIGLAALLSVSIGLINLFPIPMLDGGHLLYYAFEAVRGRPLGERAQEMGFRLGLAFVLSLMLLATFNDLVRFKLF